MNPHMTLKRVLVHPKAKGTPQETSGIVYHFPCKDFQCVYIGEMERRYWVREKKHKMLRHWRRRLYQIKEE